MLGWLLNLGFAGSGAIAVVKVDLAPAALEGQSVVRVLEGLNITRESAGNSIKREVEGLR